MYCLFFVCFLSRNMKHYFFPTCALEQEANKSVSIHVSDSSHQKSLRRSRMLEPLLLPIWSLISQRPENAVYKANIFSFANSEERLLSWAVAWTSRGVSFSRYVLGWKAFFGIYFGNRQRLNFSSIPKWLRGHSKFQSISRRYSGCYRGIFLVSLGRSFGNDWKVFWSYQAMIRMDGVMYGEGLSDVFGLR